MSPVLSASTTVSSGGHAAQQKQQQSELALAPANEDGIQEKKSDGTTNGNSNNNNKGEPREADVVTSPATVDYDRAVLEKTAGPATSDERLRRLFTFYRLPGQEDVFRSYDTRTSYQSRPSAAYGGLIFAQALAAAEQTVDERLKPHALHSFFILNVDPDRPVDYHVRRLRDGRSFCTRAVEARQDGKVAFSMQTSFHAVEPAAIMHERRMPLVPGPSETTTPKEQIQRMLDEAEKGRRYLPEMAKKMLRQRLENDDDTFLFEIRIVEWERYWGQQQQQQQQAGHSAAGSTRSDELHIHFWVRYRHSLAQTGADERLHRWIAAFNTDATLAGTAFRPHMANGFIPSMIFSLDHNIWIHHPVMRADEWHLFENVSTKAAGGRAFSEGRLWSRDGRLLISAVQESLVRTKGVTSML